MSLLILIEPCIVTFFCALVPAGPKTEPEPYTIPLALITPDSTMRSPSLITNAASLIGTLPVLINTSAPVNVCISSLLSPNTVEPD